MAIFNNCKSLYEIIENPMLYYYDYNSEWNKRYENFDKKKEIELIKDYFKLKKEVNKNYDSAKAKFLNAKENLNGIEFWKKYLSLE